MGRRAVGKWIEQAIEIQQRLAQRPMYERDENLAAEAAGIGIHPDLLRRWINNLGFVDRALQQCDLNLEDFAASLSSIDLIRRLQAVDFAKAIALRKHVLTGVVKEAKLREILQAARENLADGETGIENVPLETLHFMAADKMKTPPDLITVAATRKLSVLGELAEVDAEAHNPGFDHENIDLNPYQCALVISPRLTASRHIAADLQDVIGTVWKAAYIYDIVVFAAHSTTEIEAISDLAALSKRHFKNIKFLRPAEIRRAMKQRPRKKR